MNSAMLSCRICEATQPLAPASSCPVCSGPLDVRYVRDGSLGLLDDPQSFLNYGALLPHRDTAMPSRTPLVPAPRISAALDIDVHLKLETANPTHSFKDRMAASAVAAAHGVRDRDALLCVDREPRGGRRGRLRRGGARRRDSQPGGRRRADASFRDLRRDRVHGAGDVRGLPAPGARARAPVPVGLPRREPATRSRSRASRRSRTRSPSSSAGRRRTRSSARSLPGRSSRSSRRVSSSSPTSGS